MLFTVEKDGAEVSCSSPRCVRLLLELGWQLASPFQMEQLLEALEAERMLFPQED